MANQDGAAFDRILAALADDGRPVSHPRNGQARTRCPAHDGQADDSLSIKRVEGQALIWCFAHCPTEDVVAALGLSMSDLYDDPRGATYRYDDGRIVHRSPDKKFRQSGNTTGTATLYRLSRVQEAVKAGLAVFLCEGEKDVAAVESVGAVATTSPMGASNWRKVDPSPLYGGTITVIADNDEPGRRYARDVLASLKDKAIVRVVRAKVGKDASDHIAAGHSLGDLTPVDLDDEDAQAETGSAASLVWMANVQPEKVTWLWEGYVPAGKLTLIDGDPGDGKSTMSLDLAARVTTGSPMPDGSPSGRKGPVVMLSAEDGLADTIRPRLDAAGADVGQVAVMDEVMVTDAETGAKRARPVELPLDLPLLKKAIRDSGAVLVTIDPLMAFLAGVDSHNDQSVRRALHPLSKLADATGTAILVIRHMNKGSGSKALYRGGGSIGIAGAARAVHVVAADPDDESGMRRLLAPVKVNIAAKPPTMAYRLVPDDLHGCARISWEGTVQATADDLVNIEPAEERQEKVTAEQFLREALKDAPRRTKEVELEAREGYGISQRTLFRARTKLGVRSEQLPTGPTKNGVKKNEWWLSLPQGATDEDGDGSQPNGQAAWADCQGATPSEWQSGSLPRSEEPQEQGATVINLWPEGDKPADACPDCGWSIASGGHEDCGDGGRS